MSPWNLLGGCCWQRARSRHSGARRVTVLDAKTSAICVKISAIWLLCALVGGATGRPAHAQLRLIGLPKNGNTSRQTREEAIRAIPFDQLTDEMRNRIQAVIANPTIYRRMPRHTMECDPQLYLFLIRNPEVVVNIWDVMGATQIEMQRTGPYTFNATDGAGTKSKVELAYGTNNLHIYFGDGLYEGSMLAQRVPGRAVLVLRSQYEQNNQGQKVITSVMDMFVELDNVTVDVIAKTFHPIIGRFADLNFLESAKFVGRLSQTASQHGEAMQRLANRLDDVSPEVRKQFAEIALNVSHTAAQHSSATPTARAPVAVRPTSAKLATPPEFDLISRHPADYPVLR